jgi:hypothetical protein
MEGLTELTHTPFSTEIPSMNIRIQDLSCMNQVCWLVSRDLHDDDVNYYTAY